MNHYIKQRIKDLMQEIHNPFNGNKAKPIKRITRKQYEDKYKEEYVYDPEKGDWCDFNEHFCLVTNGTNYILVKENNKD